MKKIIAITLGCFIGAGIFAQDKKAQNSDSQKQNSPSVNKKSTSKATLEGRSFKISFTEKKGEMTGNETDSPGKTSADATAGKSKMDKAAMQSGNSGYSMFDANSKVLISFADGNLKSPIFESNGCPYHINANE